MLLHACGGFPGASRGLQGPPGASRGLQEAPGAHGNAPTVWTTSCMDPEGHLDTPARYSGPPEQKTPSK